MKSIKFLLALPCALFLLAQTSQAATIYSLNTTAGCCGAGPYGSVTLTQNGANEVDVAVSLLNPFLFISGGQAGAFGFNLTLANANVTITVDPASVAAGFSSVVLGNGTLNQHMDGFGNFDYAIEGDANHTQGGSAPIGQLLNFSVVSSVGISAANSHNPRRAEVFQRSSRQTSLTPPARALGPERPESSEPAPTSLRKAWSRSPAP